ncbi:MAG: hypothetical protein JWL98_1275 [Xanthomonadaceae bacterium]|nr:hypothetical protein [Xanthomonadaceae bacterium]
MLKSLGIAISMAALVVSTTVMSTAAVAQVPSGWQLDTGALAASGSDLLLRAPDAQIDGLFQAVHSAAQDPNDARALCTLFAPDADRSLQGLNDVAARLGPTSRSRFATALADVFVASMQSSPQPLDRAAAQQSLKAAAVTAALLHDGFVAGLQAEAGEDARCQSLRWLLDAVQSRPQTERAAMTRLLLDQGLAQVASTH